MERIQIKNLIDSYTKKLFKLKKAYLSSEIKLPRLTPSHSYKDLLQRKIEKLKALNSRFRNNSGERKVKAELSNLFQVQHVKNEYLKRILHMKNKENNNIRKYNFEINSLSDNSHNTFNSITNNSISKTNISNNKFFIFSAYPNIFFISLIPLDSNLLIILGILCVLNEPDTSPSSVIPF